MTVLLGPARVSSYIHFSGLYPPEIVAVLAKAKDRAVLLIYGEMNVAGPDHGTSDDAEPRLQQVSDYASGSTRAALKARLPKAGRDFQAPSGPLDYVTLGVGKDSLSQGIGVVRLPVLCFLPRKFHNVPNRAD